MGHDYCHRHECMCYRGCPDCNPNAKDDAAPALTPAEKAGVGDGIIEHIKKYDTKEGDPRRLFTRAQVETAIRLAAALKPEQGDGERLRNALNRTVGLVDRAVSEAREEAFQMKDTPDAEFYVEMATECEAILNEVHAALAAQGDDAQEGTR